MSSIAGKKPNAVAATHAAPAPAGSRKRPRARPYAEVVHDLEVHQVELEMQNEELRGAQLDLAAARDRFVDLYDFAPVGYFTLDDAGLVTEANLTAATMLAVTRNSMIGRSFARFVTPAHLERWHRTMRRALLGDGSVRVELMLQGRSGETFHGQLDCVPKPQPHGASTLRVTLSDVTQRKLAEMDREMAQAEHDAREAERQQVARELHEGLGQRLGALKMELSALPLQGEAAQACRDRVAAMLDALDTTVASVRQIATDLRPLMLDDLGLDAAIDWLAHDASRRLGLHLELDLDAPTPAPDERTSIALYRLAQNILEQIAHVGTITRLAVSLKQQADEMVLAFRCKHASRGVGAGRAPVGAPQAAQPLHHRARLLGARLEILDTPGADLTFVARMPLPRNTAGNRPAERRSRTGDRRRRPAP